MRFLYSIMFLCLFGWLGAQNTPVIDNGTVLEERTDGINEEQTPQADTDEALKLFIPNAFTPNEDGINDIYFISNSGFETFEFTVFDRWGNQVFSSNFEDFRWDGRVKGRKISPGVYVFVFRGVTKDNLTIRRSGNISVIY